MRGSFWRVDLESGTQSPRKGIQAMKGRSTREMAQAGRSPESGLV